MVAALQVLLQFRLTTHLPQLHDISFRSIIILYMMLSFGRKEYVYWNMNKCFLMHRLKVWLFLFLKPC
jgi:hypothetical protein